MAEKRRNPSAKLNKQREIEQKKRKKRRVLLILILIILIFLAIGAYLLNSDKFLIKEIIVEGNNQLTEEEVCELSKINIGDNIFKKLSIVAKVRLKENGYIEDAEIEKLYPDKIKITVQENTKDFQIFVGEGKYIQINSQGYIIDTSTEKLDIPTITGMEIQIEDFEKLKRLDEDDLNKMEQILHIEDEYQKKQIEYQIQQIDTGSEFILHLDDDNIIINLGDATVDLPSKILYAKKLIEEEKGMPGTIFLNGNLNEGFEPYFRAK